MLYAVIENLYTVIEFINEELEARDCDPHEQTQIAIAVEEIFTNIAHYAYSPYTGEVLVQVSIGKELLIIFEDQGKPYNPLMQAEPDITLSIDERSIGGLGVYMVKNIMDTVDYNYYDQKNVLTMRKSLSKCKNIY